MHNASHLSSLLVILVSCLTVATILNRFRQPTLIGYIIGGILVGPHVFGIVPYENVELLAEIGVGLLMFTIGLELSLQKLLRVKYIAIFGGTLQVGLMIWATWMVGIAIGWSPLQSFTIGCIVALSSTAVILRLLAERGEVGSTHGNISTGILLYQDIIAIPLLTIIPILALGEHMTLSLGFGLIGRFTVFVIALYGAARFLVPKILEVVAKTHNKELFSISILCICTGIAVISQQLGLSLALGAFLAGLIVSESDFGNQATSEILPLKDSFSAIFFAAIGMLLDPRIFVEHWFLLSVGILLVIPAKILITFAISLLFRYPLKTALFVALGLSQIGEFSFLLLMVAYNEKIFDEVVYQFILSGALISIIATPYLLKMVPSIANLLKFIEGLPWLTREGDNQESTGLDAKLAPEGLAEIHGKDSTGHVVLCGYGPTGAIIMRNLVNAGLPVNIVDLNYRIVQNLKAQGLSAIYGDCSSSRIIEAAGIANALMLIITIPDPNAMRTIVKKIKSAYPDVPILVRVKYNTDRERMIGLGANEVVWEEHEAGMELSRKALSRLHFTPELDVEHTQDLIIPIKSKV